MKMIKEFDASMHFIEGKKFHLYVRHSNVRHLVLCYCSLSSGKLVTQINQHTIWHFVSKYSNLKTNMLNQSLTDL